MNLRLFSAIFFLLATAGISRAQWFSTTYALKGGWNAIYLHGDASHATPDVLFPNSGQTAGVLEVWRWNPKPNQVQFTASPLIPSAGTPEWNVWKRPVPPALIHPETNLSIISGQTAYLVKCSGTAATAWSVPILQRAMPPSATWVRAGANLLGFPSKFTTPNYPSFSTYFQSFPAALAANAKVFKYVGGDLGAANPLQIFSPTLEQVDRDKAYWFESEVVGNFFAPLDISLSQSTGLDFGRTGSVITARLRNTTAANMTLTLTPAFSLAAPTGQPPVVANTMVPLTRRTFNAVTGTWTETAISGAYTEAIGANSTVELSFGINRALMAVPPSNNFYASLLKLTDSGGHFDIALPVSARVASLAGLWIGDATVTDVSSQVQATATATATVKNGVLTGITVTGGGGFGYDSVPVPVIAAPTATATATVTLSPGVTAAATAVLTGGVVTGFTITNVGSGYTAPPLISIAAPASGTTATATAVLTGGTVTGITISNGGSGYTAVPAVTIGGAGTMTAITITNPGSGYITTPSVTIGFPILGVRALATATVSNGRVTGLTITNPGSGYGATTTVVISQPTLGRATATATRTAGTLATATAVLTGGVVTGFNISNGGSGYTDPPLISIAAPASGTTATATADITNGILTGITIDDGGSGYTAAPVVTIAGPSTITAITLTDPGSGYTIPPTVTFGAPALGVTATAVATVSNGIITGLAITNVGSGYSGTPGVTISLPPPGTAPAAANAVISGGTVSSISVSNPGAGYYSPPAITIAPPASGTTATAVAVVGNGGITGITILTPGSGYTATPVVTIAPPPAPIAATVTAIVKGGKVTGFTITNGGGRGYRGAPAITIPDPPPLGTRTARTPPLRVILHVDDSGTARLLSQVFAGTLDDTGAQGLCTSESGLLAAEKANASRIVAAHLPLDRVLASGTGSASATGAQPLVRSVSIPFDDKTNPFVHRYHPDHDNKDARGDPLDAGVESYDITRTFSFRFTTTPPAGVSTIGWGSTAIGGDYSEVVKGLHKQDLTATGTFVLRRASEIGTLTIPPPVP